MERDERPGVELNNVVVRYADIICPRKTGWMAAFAKVLSANVKVFSTDGKMPADDPTNVLETLKAADTTTDWSKVDLSKTFTNGLVEALN
ncbi:MAG TPA: hypothetical protein VGQ62_18890 [Chloroflexota bacterium]|jgi:hypothetical protein|nr:hypothetical protein [Chloroflexota bacterium]